MNIDTATALGMEYFEIENLHSQVIEIMNKFGMIVKYATIPKIKTSYLIKEKTAHYDLDKHEIVINPFRLPKVVIRAMIAHEMTHSLQGLTKDVFSTKYSERVCEHEAYAVQDVVQCFYNYQITRKFWLRVSTPKQLKKFLAVIAKRIQSDELYTSMKDRHDDLKSSKVIEDAVRKSIDGIFFS